MAVSSLYATEAPEAGLAEVDICTLEINIMDEIPSIVFLFFFSLGLIYWFYGMYYCEEFTMQRIFFGMSVLSALSQCWSPNGFELQWQVPGSCQGFIMDELKAVGSRWAVLCLKLTQAALMRSHLLHCLASTSFKSDKKVFSFVRDFTCAHQVNAHCGAAC